MARIQWRHNRLRIATLFATVAILPGSVGEVRAGQDPPVAVVEPMPSPPRMAMGFFGGEGKTVTGAPYSAEAVTEMIQTLADGNRIVQRQTASVARDGQGRTRRDMALAAVGPWMPEDAPKIAFITDPVAGVMYQLNEQRQTAMRQPLGGDATWSFKAESGAVGSVSTVTAARVGAVRQKIAGTPGAFVGALPMLAPPDGAGADVETEVLGTQAIEGVEATGTRTTTTIPAGRIGNEQPIKIVSESWYSADLQTMVLTRRSDPRFGETTYRLTNIARSEPAPSLFEVPAGYTITEEPDIIMPKKIFERRAPK